MQIDRRRGFAVSLLSLVDSLIDVCQPLTLKRQNHQKRVELVMFKG